MAGSRLNELNCICDIAQIIDRSNLTPDELCQDFIGVISRYRTSDISIVGVTIRIGSKDFRSTGFQMGNWKRIADILVKEVRVGTLEIHCLTPSRGFEQKQSFAWLSFLTDFVAERIGRAVERTQILWEIKRREERFRALAEHTSDWVWEMDTNCVYTYSSPKSKEIIGYEPEEVIGRYEWFSSLPEYLEEYKKKLRSIIRSQQPFVQLENSNLHKDGRLVILETSGVPFFDEFGRLLGYRGIDRDITNRKSLEKALRDSEEFASDLLHMLPNPIIVLYPDTSIKYVNPAFERLVGYCSSDVVGAKPPFPWQTEGTRSQTSMQYKKSVSKKAKNIELLLQKKHGETFWVEKTLLPIIENGGIEYYLETWVDITEPKRLRESMQFYIMMATSAQEEERKRIAHELHDETIQSLYSLLQDIDALMNKEKHMSESIVSNLKRLKVRIDTIMGETRRLSQELRPGLLDKFGLIPSIELLIEETRKTDNLNCRIEIFGSKRRLSSEIELMLYRVTQEALHNVRKHSRATEAIVRIGFSKRKIKLSIIDNGIGFELPDDLYEFAHVYRMGLLSMTERIRLIGGSISIISEVGKGTNIVAEVSIPNAQSKLPSG
ncbi:MAG: PAS domain S-box protein [Dehalococcoidales bacterium]|nr:PAS domain S-box protein [Dehalococcoidales bacterium]